ncbi:protein usd [Bacillus glycinifermentans]|uniref:Protein usd n=1 Tax=Bacillus glycinifermentans TaxID=1664069 RepID=A0AAJ4D4U7_9BACI|nr:protein usd [Bacillus glycinifermentans]NUJ16435.1 protein usd [Bacillus glycinifermentans]QAT67316.1 protein usd [Bacillus glycinifermentans]
MGVFQNSTWNSLKRSSCINSIFFQHTDLISHFSHPF